MGNAYYYHDQSGEVSWTLPATDLAAAAHGPDDPAAGAAAGGARPGAAAAPSSWLPPGWTSVRDPDSGADYFHNVEVKTKKASRREGLRWRTITAFVYRCAS